MLQVDPDLFVALNRILGPALRFHGLRVFEEPNVLPRLHYLSSAEQGIGYSFEIWIDKRCCERGPDKLIVPTDPNVLGEIGAYMKHPDRKLKVSIMPSLPLSQVTANIREYIGQFAMMVTLLPDEKAFADWTSNATPTVICHGDFCLELIERTIAGSDPS